jgi:GntR family transcriptional regulator, transcriptional repressor for pyruvate dehydrogenase complex
MKQARRIAGEIQEFIRREGIAPGGRLPTEHALARRFRVSRTLVREAIQALKTMGIVESRPRVGLRVLPFDPTVHLDPMIDRIRTEDERRELYEFRRLIEPEILRLVAERAKPWELAALEGPLRVPLPKGPALVREAFARDVAFHEGLWKLAGNRFVSGLRGLLVRYFAKTEHARSVTEPELRRANGQHLAVVRALLSGDLARARRELAKNLDTFRPAADKVRGPNGDRR